MVRILRLPEGVDKHLYARAMKDIPRTKLLAARRVMGEQGIKAAVNLRDFGPDALDLMEKRGEDAVEAIHTHQKIAFDSHSAGGASALRVLTVLQPPEFKRLQAAFPHGLDRHDYNALAAMLAVHGDHKFRAMVKGSQEHLRQVVNDYLFGRTP